MSVPNETLQKLLQEIGQKKAFAEQQLAIVKQQKTVKNRESRILRLTANEVEMLPKDIRVYEGVGKMFVCTPIPDVQKRLSSEADEIKAEMTNLDKKEDYLERRTRTARAL